MSPEELAERLPDHLKRFDVFIEYGERVGIVTDGLRAYERELGEWITREVGDVPDDVVKQARGLLGITVSDWYKYALDPPKED